jgi:hypothetical protein
MSKIRRVFIGGIVAIAAGLLAAMVAFATDAPDTKSTAIGPTIKIFKGDKCVEPTDEMRRNHMKYILHQRDKTMHEGIRTTKYSLKNCIDCHADPKTNSVLGKDGFCESCHEYASVSIDCFSCHSPAPEPADQTQKASLAAPMRLDDKMSITVGADNDKGSQP